MTRRPRPRGRLIALEGIDGAGKSSLARSLAAALRRRGFAVRVRREPADRRIGRLAQEASLGDAWTGAIYFTVDRHLALPDLQNDLNQYDIVLTDRSYFSTLAYQGSALPSAERRRLASLERAATRAPDRVILLDLPVPVALRRTRRRTGDRGPLERERTLRRVAHGYQDLARRHRWIVLDARGPKRALLIEALERLGFPRAGPRRRGRSNR